MSLHAMISDVLVMPGNSNMFGNQIYAYNDQSSREFHQSIPSGTQPASPSYHDEVSFEHFIPPGEQMSSPSSMSTSPNDNSNSYSKKDKSRKLRSTKSPASEEEESPEDKSRRRREQNRIAQRTFRERKDKYIQNLESHIKLLDASNKDLQASYRQSTDQINALYTQLLETQGELDYWRCLAQPSTPPTTIHSTTSSDNTPTISVVGSLFLQGRHHLPVMSDMQLQCGRFT